MKILELPQIEPKIIKAINDRELVIFIGAGVSRLVGCDSWIMLADNLIERCFIEKMISEKEREALQKEKDSKKKITISYRIFEQKGKRTLFFDEMKGALKYGKESKDNSVYKIIEKIPAIKITTNADCHLSCHYMDDNVLYRKENFLISELSISKLFQIHGSITDDDTVVFMLDKYFELYNDTGFQKFITNIFNNYTILFVGYGLGEFELLDYLFQKAKEDERKREHFMLSPFFLGEENIYQLEQLYYKELGITLIPYAKDYNGYNQLVNVLLYWDTEIDQTTPFNIDFMNEIDQASDDDDRTRVLQLTRNSEIRRNYFFDRVAVIEKPELWLESIIKAGYLVTKLNPSEVREQDDPKTIRFPIWNINGYLLNLSERNKKINRKEVTVFLVKFIDEIIENEENEENRKHNYHTEYTLLRVIFNLPISSITEKHIKYFDTSLNNKWETSVQSSLLPEKIVPYLLEEKAKHYLMIILEIILKPNTKQKKSSFYSFTSRVENYWLMETLQKYGDDIIKLIGNNLIEICEKYVLQIIQEDTNQFSQIDIPSIEDSSQIHFQEEYIIQLIITIRKSLELSKKELVEEKITGYLGSNYTIFKRLAIHTINHRFNEFQNLFWEYQGNILDLDGCKHELYELLKDNKMTFSEKQNSRIIELIEEKEYDVYTEGRSDEEIQKIIAYSKKELLSALLPSEDKQINEKYSEYERLAPWKLNNPGWDYYVSSASFIEEIPEEIRKLSIKSDMDIASYLCKYDVELKTKDTTFRYDTLTSVFREMVLHDSIRFSDNINFYNEIPIRYINSLLRGFWEAWRNKKYLNWDNVLNYIQNTIAKYNIESYNERDEDVIRNTQGLVFAIADLIQEGTKHDENAFEKALLPKAETIIINLEQIIKSNISGCDKIDNNFLNSPLGSLYSALINISLRNYRLCPNKDVWEWNPAIKDIFDKKIKSNNRTIEFNYALGKFFPYLLTLDQKWIHDNVDEILNKHDMLNWKITIHGYFFNARQLYIDILKLFVSSSNIDLALNTKFDSNEINRNIVSYIAVAYIKEIGDYTLDENPIFKVIESIIAENLLYLTDFFWRNKIDIEKNSYRLVTSLFEKVYDKAIINCDNTSMNVLSNLCKWIVFYDSFLPELLEKLKECFVYSNLFNNKYSITKILSEKSEVNTQEIGELFLIMLTHHSGHFYFKPEYVVNIVENLLKKDEIKIVNEINYIFLQHGQYFLKDILNQYKS